MSLTRRRFLGQATPLGLIPFLPSCGGVFESTSESPAPCCESGVTPFVHGIASGDPLGDAVILWTRVTPVQEDARAVDVSWRVASDREMTDIVAQGEARTDASLDYTIKVDAQGLAGNTTYYYDFSALGARSRVGRTKTLPTEGAPHARLAVASCANYPAGYFNAYRLIAERADIDLVLHLGDYLYEYGNGTLGDGTAIGRLPSPDKEAVTLHDYRQRHAQYKADPDLQELHRQHPFIAIWDDHEVANNAYRDGAANHQPESEGDWVQRKGDALRAYFEWMPIRLTGPADAQRVYRSFAWGDLFDLIMLDTRFAGRDRRIVSNCDLAGIEDPARSLLGAEQEAWLFEALRGSHARGARWRLLGQQVMFGQLSDAAEGCVSHPDQWDGYAQNRSRVLEVLRGEGIDNVLILTGDAHSSWAMDITENPFDPMLYDPATGEGSLAVEFVAPGITSPGANTGLQEILRTHPHLKFADFTRRGYVLLDLTPERAQAEWYFVTSLSERLASEEFAAAFKTTHGANRLVAVAEPSPARSQAAAPAP
jgi:alkaline phosphatase D